MKVDPEYYRDPKTGIVRPEYFTACWHESRAEGRRAFWRGVKIGLLIGVPILVIVIVEIW